MLKAVSTYLFVKERLHPGILDGLARSGVEAVEIFAARQHLDYANRKAHVKEIAEWFRGSGIPLHSVHSPLYADYEWGRAGAPPLNIAATDRAARVEAMDEIKRALEIAEQIPFRFLVQHVGTPNESFGEKKIEDAMTSIEHLRAFAKPLGVRILLENIPNELSTPDKLVELIHSGHFDDVGVCFDFGHAHIMSSVREGFEILRSHIRSTHVHDNAKDKDSHLWPGATPFCAAFSRPKPLRALGGAPGHRLIFLCASTCLFPHVLSRRFTAKTGCQILQRGLSNSRQRFFVTTATTAINMERVTLPRRRFSRNPRHSPRHHRPCSIYSREIFSLLSYIFLLDVPYYSSGAFRRETADDSLPAGPGPMLLVPFSRMAACGRGMNNGQS